MAVPELVTLGLTAHGAVALVVLGGGLPRYAERSDVHGKAVQDTEELLSRVGERITGRLEDNLGDFFREDAATGSTVILNAEGVEPQRATYKEKVTSPLSSDRFREVVRGFMESNVEALVHYRAISDAHNIWCRWALRRRWGVFLLAIWEVACIGALGVLGAIVGRVFSSDEVVWSFLPTGLLIIWFFVSEFVLLRQQDVIDDRRNRYKGI